MFKRKKNRDKNLMQKGQKLGTPLISHFEPMSAFSEQYRTLRTNIEFAQVGKNLQTLAVTSSIANEGKSTTTVNLAYTYAKTGRKVLVIDADLRKPNLHLTFQLNNSRGLSTLLVKDNLNILDVIQYSEELELYFLTSGAIPPNPSELVASTKMITLLEELKQIFDLIIFDTPPAHSVSDAQIISSKVDGIILIARQNFVTIQQVRETTESLKNVNANILGFVLNDVSNKKDEGYGYYEYSTNDEA
ncbi:CpsD/CapB family tyrosine-protein kinase [Aerococcus urinaeequi]|uniref:CpsD/CapB family tyrosine-protein kinase n=1 Tax=Aerococcus urinaeequi TaxID=51665 RepID=UPI0022E12E8A|nr:CpsD/CapB family tyrosine-protein kinase [Aerococcus urinaeequi]